MSQFAIFQRGWTWTVVCGFSALTAMALAGPLPLAAGEDAPATRKAAPDDAEVLDMFQAVDQQLLKVQLIPRDATVATLIVENQGDKPLRVRMPEAFAGVPVLAQIGGINGGGGLGGGSQGIGGGMGMGMGGGFFNVAPDSIRRIKVPTVCLEHGKPDPNARIPYKIIPLSEFTKDARIHRLCVMLGNKQLDQTTAQAAAWHLASGLSWDELAKKVKTRHLNGSVEMFFHPRQVSLAARAVAVISAQTELAAASSSSPGDEPTQDEPVSQARVSGSSALP